MISYERKKYYVIIEGSAVAISPPGGPVRKEITLVCCHLSKLLFSEKNQDVSVYGKELNVPRVVYSPQLYIPVNIYLETPGKPC